MQRQAVFRLCVAAFSCSSCRKSSWRGFWAGAWFATALILAGAPAVEADDRETAVSRPWTLRPFASAISPQGDGGQGETVFRSLMTITRYRESAELDSGSAAGLGVEYRFNPRWGLAASLSRGSFDIEYSLESTSATSFSEPVTTQSEHHGTLSTWTTTLGPSFHPMRKGRADWFVEPFLAWSIIGDRRFEDHGDVGLVDGDSNFGLGVATGVDLPIGRNPDWALHVSVRWLQTETRDPRLSLTIDPLYATVGVSYRI